MTRSRCVRYGAGLVWLVWLLTLATAGSAQAGYGVQPASGSTTGPEPTFLVYLDASDTDAIVYVATTPTMSSDGFPDQEVGSCVPVTPFGEPNKFTCQPSYYLSTGTSALAPGTYYWWVSYLSADPATGLVSIQSSGPFSFTVAQPQAPANTYLVSPDDGATVSATPKLVINAPGAAQLRFYVSDSAARLGDGSPAGLAVASCSGTTSGAGSYYCPVDPGLLTPGESYYWWVVVTLNGSGWIYGPRSFSVATPTPPPPNDGGSGGGTSLPPPHNLSYAPYLPSSTHYTGRSVKQTRLSKAAYGLSKFLHVPKSVDVACWSARDWANISGQNPESAYSILGFHDWLMPHWVDLSPGICHTFETLLYHRPRYANVITANALDTLTHEMIHALGIRNEARTECYAMQLSFITGTKLGLPLTYAENLDRLSLRNYHSHPPRYVDTSRCRENGPWDLYPNRPSLPWHMFGV